MTEPDVKVGFGPASWKQDLDLYLADRAAGMNAYLIRRTRLAGIARLNAMSDADLADLGLQRQDIPAFVFEDILPE